MKPLPSKSNSAWQDERANRLQRACRRLQSAIQGGKPIQKAIRRVARNLNGKPFRCDPSRRLALSPASLRRHWDKWKRSGEVPAAFALKYTASRSAIAAPVLVRFTEYCSRTCHKSMRAAWLKFCARGGNAGPGQRQGKPLKISFDQLYHNFPAAGFYQLQSHLKAIAAAQLALWQDKIRIISDVRRRLPDRLKSKCAKRQICFEI